MVFDISIELDDGKTYRKPLHLMVKSMVSCRFSQQNQSIDIWGIQDEKNASRYCGYRYVCHVRGTLVDWQVSWGMVMNP